jgi:hypothetical protein
MCFQLLETLSWAVCVPVPACVQTTAGGTLHIDASMQAKEALERKKTELEAERSSTEKLQRKFAAIHSTLSSSKAPAYKPPTANV